MDYVLTGKRQGHTGPLQGFVFRDGICTIPGDGTTPGEATAKNILTRFASAYPAHMVDMSGPQYKLRPEFNTDEEPEENEENGFEEFPDIPAAPLTKAQQQAKGKRK